MDEAYNSVDIHGRGGAEFGPALRVAVTVIGHSSAGFAITDGGSKSFALDGPPPRVFLGKVMVGRIEWCGDGSVASFRSRALRRYRLEQLPNARFRIRDPTINLHDFLHVVSNDRLVAIWPIEARGRAD